MQTFSLCHRSRKNTARRWRRGRNERAFVVRGANRNVRRRGAGVAPRRRGIAPVAPTANAGTALDGAAAVAVPASAAVRQSFLALPSLDNIPATARWHSKANINAAWIAEALLNAEILHESDFDTYLEPSVYAGLARWARETGLVEISADRGIGLAIHADLKEFGMGLYDVGGVDDRVWFDDSENGGLFGFRFDAYDAKIGVQCGHQIKKLNDAVNGAGWAVSAVAMMVGGMLGAATPLVAKDRLEESWEQGDDYYPDDNPLCKAQFYSSFPRQFLKSEVTPTALKKLQRALRGDLSERQRLIVECALSLHAEWLRYRAARDGSNYVSPVGICAHQLFPWVLCWDFRDSIIAFADDELEAFSAIPEECTSMFWSAGFTLERPETLTLAAQQLAAVAPLLVRFEKLISVLHDERAPQGATLKQVFDEGDRNV